MNIKDFDSFKWKKDSICRIDTIALVGLTREEQEFHLWIDNQRVFVDCSLQRWLTRLGRLPNFRASRILISKGSGNDGFILSVAGMLDTPRITIGKKRIMSEIQRLAMVERGKKVKKR